ncbi:hypothetical protein B4N89_29370 [Embleya scabrispora]|uniref:Uncharacterized protein n=1 Tax=Embleya scabrispora TaxID=159449 RepID=A0A1T3P6K7_9ACTN|nr:hypothetical protein B4N89_29370 [Embleya scabrispora]
MHTPRDRCRAAAAEVRIAVANAARDRVPVLLARVDQNLRVDILRDEVRKDRGVRIRRAEVMGQRLDANHPLTASILAMDDGD